jgi:hypothetical protein
MRRSTAGSFQNPAIAFCGRRMRDRMNPCSRSPCADWFRFMKSMSISSHGMSRLNCVSRWSSGFCSIDRPRIHIFDGENVCIHVITPMQAGSAFAARTAASIPSESRRTGWNATVQGISAEAVKKAAIVEACAATVSRTAGP